MYRLEPVSLTLSPTPAFCHLTILRCQLLFLFIKVHGLLFQDSLSSGNPFPGTIVFIISVPSEGMVK